MSNATGKSRVNEYEHKQKYKLVFFVPPLNLAAVKQALFATGAGTHAGPPVYTECCFTTPGVGQFRGSGESNPAIGEAGKVEEVGEARCEMLCEGEEVVRAAVAALKSSHPYEVPAYEVYRIEDF